MVLCFFSDGASCEGEFFETLNMAALWKIPLIFVCENNGYAISVPTRLSQATPDIADRARGFGIPSFVIDGNDPIVVQEATAEAISRARQGDGPTMLECKTVRWERHSGFSAGRYDDPEEAQRWKKSDPIPRFAARLLELGATAAQLEAEEAAARAIIHEAVEFALASPLPGPESLDEGIFAEG